MHLSQERYACRSLAAIVCLMLLMNMAAASIEVIFIKSPGCEKCAAAERALDNLKSEGWDINITSYVYFSDEGHKVIKKYNAKDVPSIIINNKVIGYRQYDGDNDKLNRLLIAALKNQSINGTGLNLTDQKSIAGNETSLDLSRISPATIFTVFGAGFLAGFNPCLLGILVFLAASVMASSKRRRDLIKMIVSFSFGIFFMYLLFGLGLQHIFQARSAEEGFRFILTIFLIIMGLTQVADAWVLHKGRKSLFRTDWALKYVEAGVAKSKFSSYFLIGALFSLVKAPCVGAVYLAILDVISSSSYLAGATYLAVFNLGIVLPIILLGGAIALGLSPEQVDKFRKDYRSAIRLVTGLALIALAPLIYFQLI